jgi:hypothetical protein
MSAFRFNDLFFSDRRPGIDVRATITLLPETLRARRSDATVRWRPNHNFGAPEGREFYIGQVELEPPGTIEPGQTRDALIRFFDGPGLKELLVPGRSWRVQEGPTLVATACVLEVLSQA